MDRKNIEGKEKLLYTKEQIIYLYNGALVKIKKKYIKAKEK